VRPGQTDPQLEGKRPAEAPPATITAGADWNPIQPLTLSAQLRWVSAEYQDDLNTIKLGSALTVDLGAGWRFHDHLSVFGKVENLMNANVATAYTTGVFNIAAPRTFEVGLSYAQ
jgi:outer membrane receptor protein involved in Fe transport